MVNEHSQIENLISEDDESIRVALEEANIPALMAALVHVTGDIGQIRGKIRPITVLLEENEDGLTEEERAEIRELAYEALIAFRDGGCKLPDAPDESAMHEMINFVSGYPVPDGYMPVLEEELGLFERNSRTEQWNGQVPEQAKADFKVLVIGAGMSGILAAIRLEQSGIPYVVVDKNDVLGGTWYENTYPGCRVDSPNHLYSYLFERHHDWPGYFSTRETLFEYFDQCVDNFGIRGNIQLGTSVESAEYDEKTALWNVHLAGPGGQEALQFNAVVTALGQLNVPKLPDIKGLDSFEGISFHSAQWEHEHNLKGKRVAVIGTGASATQFVPIIADDTDKCLVFQRSAPWLIPTPLYHEPISPGKMWLLKHVPSYADWYRLWLFRRDAAEGSLPLLRADAGWNKRDDSVGSDNEELRVMMTDYIKDQLTDFPELFAKSVPDYPFGGKRPLRDCGVWLETFKSGQADLIDTPIVEITPNGIVTEDGEEYPVDVIIYGTGFHADKFLWPIEFTGRNGVKLSEQWADGPRAYKGISIPNFPNLFCLYGPNTNIVVGSSIVFFSECGMRYVLRCLKLLLEGGHAAMDCRKDVHDAYNEKIDAGNLTMAWGAPKVRSWYKNAQGRVTQNWPGTHLEFWQETEAPDPEDYEFLESPR